MALCLGYKFTAVDAAGNPLAAGLVYTYAPGTTTDKATYSDRALSSANANPVVLDAAGQADIYLSGLTKLVIKTSAGVTVDTVDNVSGLVEYYDTPTFNSIVAREDLTVGDDASIGGDLTVTGDMVADDATLGGSLSVAENTTLQGGLVLGTAVTHDYAAGTTAWTLSAAEELGVFYYTSNTGGAANMVVAGTALRMFVLYNGASHAITVKVGSSTGVAVASGKTALLAVTPAGTEILRLTPDA